MLDAMRAQLAAHIGGRIVDEILEHYNTLKIAFRLQDWEKCLLRAGKFAEAIMKGIHFVRTGQPVKSISVDREINEVANRTDLDDSIRLLIPRTVRVIYDHRSRRGGAHSHPLDPNPMDCTVVTSLADWVLAELARLYYTTDPEQAASIVSALIAKSIPFVERIAEDYVALLPGASARQEIGLILHSRYPERTTTAQLKRWLPHQSPANISMSLLNMEKAKQIHRNSDGAVLTSLGVGEIEEEMARHLDSAQRMKNAV